MTNSGRFTAVAISLMSSAEVFVARIAPCFDDAVELAEHVLLHIHVLEDRFDDEIAIREILELERAFEERHALLDVVHRETAALCAALVVLANDVEAAIERILLRLDDRHGDADIGEVHGNAAAHRAGADDADLPDRDDRRVFRHIGNLPHLSLGEEHIALRRRLRRRSSAP